MNLDLVPTFFRRTLGITDFVRRRPVIRPTLLALTTRRPSTWPYRPWTLVPLGEDNRP